MFVCAIVGLVAAMAIPFSRAGLERSRGWAAARFVASRLVAARVRAVGRGAAVGVRFDGDGATTDLLVFADGNHNGILSNEIAAGVDPRLEAPVRVSDLFPGVTMTFEPGAPRLFSFSPDGTATTGSLYLTGGDGTRFAVRVLGATARVRVERYVAARDAWTEAY